MVYRLKFFSFLLVAATAVFAPASDARAQNPEKDIRVVLEQRDADIKAVLKAGDLDSDKKEKLKDLINSAIDFRSMGAAALGQHWDPLSEAQRIEFVTVFGDIVRSQSVADLEVYRSPVTYGAIVVAGKKASVNTSITYKDAPTEVVYELANHDDAWWVTDIILKDVSTVEGYARSFQSVVRKKGFESLMEKLRKKHSETTAVG